MLELEKSREAPALLVGWNMLAALPMGSSLLKLPTFLIPLDEVTMLLFPSLLVRMSSVGRAILIVGG